MSKFKIITNGFDPADYEAVTYKKNEKFTICHTGVLRNKKTPDYFIKAVAELVNEHPELKNKMQVFFVGNFPINSQHLIKELSLDEVIYVTGYLPHQECIQYQLESNVLLLLLFEEEDGKSVYPGKMFEYIAARSPILAAVPEGLSADFIHSEEVGIVVHPRNIDKMKNVIYQFYLQHENRKLLLNDASFNRFDRKELTRQLTETDISSALPAHQNSAEPAFCNHQPNRSNQTPGSPAGPSICIDYPGQTTTGWIRQWKTVSMHHPLSVCRLLRNVTPDPVF